LVGPWQIICDLPHYAHTVGDAATNFCMMIKLDVRKLFKASTTPPSLDKKKLWNKCWRLLINGIHYSCG